MVKRQKVRRQKQHHIHQDWLPIDRRILPDIISFSCVKGPLRIFLQIEMTLSLLIVIGTCILVIIRYWPF